MHEIRAEIAANVWQVVVEEGQMVAEGDEICILESMKMEIPVVTEVPGVVRELHVAPEQTVQEGDLITLIDGAEGEAVVDTFRPSFEEALDAITAYRAPVIAAVNGPAIGAGMQLAVACDLRVAAPNARFAIPGGKLGVHLSPKNIWRLVLLVGQGAARDFLLAGRSVDV